MLTEAYSESAVKKEQVCRSGFQDGRKDGDDDERLGHFSTSRTDENSDRNDYDRSPSHNKRSR